jgi:ABC-type phosphate transport system substrate-binding protein
MGRARQVIAVMRRAASALLLALLAPVQAAPVLDDEVVVIVNKANSNAVDIDFVRRVYTGSLKGWPDGSPVLAFDQAEDSETRDHFSAAVLRKSSANLKAIWSQNIFTGKALPPRVASPDVEMKRAVAADRHAIGYVRRSQLDDSVKALER